MATKVDPKSVWRACYPGRGGLAYRYGVPFVKVPFTDKEVSWFETLPRDEFWLRIRVRILESGRMALGIID